MGKVSAIFWLPRLLAILVIVFSSLFALDVLGEDLSFLNRIVALVMHLIPQVLIALALWIAWRMPRAGGILFFLFSMASLGLFGRPFIMPAHFILTFPLLVIGILFLTQDQIQRAKKGTH